MEALGANAATALAQRGRAVHPVEFVLAAVDDDDIRPQHHGLLERAGDCKAGNGDDSGVEDLHVALRPGFLQSPSQMRRRSHLLWIGISLRCRATQNQESEAVVRRLGKVRMRPHLEARSEPVSGKTGKKPARVLPVQISSIREAVRGLDVDCKRRRRQ